MCINKQVLPTLLPPLPVVARTSAGPTVILSYPVMTVNGIQLFYKPINSDVDKHREGFESRPGIVKFHTCSTWPGKSAPADTSSKSISTSPASEGAAEERQTAKNPDQHSVPTRRAKRKLHEEADEPTQEMRRVEGEDNELITKPEKEKKYANTRPPRFQYLRVTSYYSGNHGRGITGEPKAVVDNTLQNDLLAEFKKCLSNQYTSDSEVASRFPPLTSRAICQRRLKAGYRIRTDHLNRGGGNQHLTSKKKKEVKEALNARRFADTKITFKEMAKTQKVSRSTLFRYQKEIKEADKNPLRVDEKSS